MSDMEPSRAVNGLAARQSVKEWKRRRQTWTFGIFAAVILLAPLAIDLSSFAQPGSGYAMDQEWQRNLFEGGFLLGVLFFPLTFFSFRNSAKAGARLEGMSRADAESILSALSESPLPARKRLGLVLSGREKEFVGHLHEAPQDIEPLFAWARGDSGDEAAGAAGRAAARFMPDPPRGTGTSPRLAQMCEACEALVRSADGCSLERLDVVFALRALVELHATEGESPEVRLGMDALEPRLLWERREGPRPNAGSEAARERLRLALSE